MESEIKTFCYRSREENDLKKTKAGTKRIKTKMIISVTCVMLALIAVFGIAGFMGESGVGVSADAISGAVNGGATEDTAAGESAVADSTVTTEDTAAAEDIITGNVRLPEETCISTVKKDNETNNKAAEREQKLTKSALNERPSIRKEEFLCEGLPADSEGRELILFNEYNNEYDAMENYIPVMMGQKLEESEPEEPQIVVPADVPDALVYTYNEDMCKELSDREYEILCRIVEAEAGDQDIYGEMLVANVIINRMNDPHFPDTVEEVVFQKIGNSYQFSPTNDGRYYTVEVSEQTIRAVDRVLTGEDYSSGSEYFFQRSLTSKKNSTWFERNLDFVVKYGCHEFYREK